MAIRFTRHAVRRMAEEGISRDGVLAVLRLGAAIEAYPHDTPYPSRLMLGWVAGRPVHVVVALASSEDTIVVTTYRPDPERWNETFTARRPR